MTTVKKYNKGQYGYRNHHKKVETGKVAFGAAMIIAQLIDPNTFDGGSSPFDTEPVMCVKLRRGDGGVEELPLLYDYYDNSRGLGLADLSRCLQEKRQPKINGQMSLHVLEIMLGIFEAAKTGEYHLMESTCQKPEALFHDAPFETEI